MRSLINILTLLMLCGLLGGLVHLQQSNSVEVRRLEQTRSEVTRFQRQILLQATLRRTVLNQWGFPERIDPDWFEDALPENPLLGSHHPWVEIAHEDQLHLAHPLNRAAMSSDDARFWYNPRAGVVRARVPSLPSDADTLEMYNFINNSNLDTLYEELPDPSQGGWNF